MKTLLCAITFLALFLTSIQLQATIPNGNRGSKLATIHFNKILSPDFLKPDLTAEPVSESEMKVTLTDRSDEDDHYKLYRIEENGPGVYQEDFAGNQLGTQQDFYGNVRGGFIYTYYVDAILSNGTVLSRVAEVSVQALLEPPTMIMGYPPYEVCGSQVLVEWSQINESPGTKTEIFRSLSPDRGYGLVAVGESSLYLDDVSPRQTYYYKVRDRRGDAISPFSEVKTVTTESDYFAPVFTVQVVSNGVEIKVQDNSYADQRYQISRYDEETHDNYMVLNSNLVMSDSGRTYTLIDQTTASNIAYTYVLNAKVTKYCETQSWPWDEEVASQTVTTPTWATCTGTGSLTRDLWAGVTGTDLLAIPTNSPPTSTSEITVFETPNYAGNNYGARVRGFICVPQTGNYTFWIASDDQSELYLSMDQLEENKYPIASVSKNTKVRQWDKYPTQKSEPVFLVAGRQYYIEALHKEGNGADHLAVGWQLPDGVMERPIPGNRLISFEAMSNQAPTVSITNPLDNYEENSATYLDIEAYATDSDGSIAKVEFYVNEVKLGEDASAPYSYHWTNIEKGTYQIKVVAYDNENAAIADIHTYIHNTPDCEGAGSVIREIWTNISGTNIASIPVDTSPDQTATLLDFRTPQYSGNNYGSRIRGYLCVPATGNYTFWIASDDRGELWLSTDAATENKRRIAWVSGYTPYENYEKYPSQRSAGIYLVKGQRYYFEALHKEADGNDHLSVGWQLPDGTLERPIPGTRLIPFETEQQMSAARAETAVEIISIEDGEGIQLYPNPASDRIVTMEFTIRNISDLQQAIVQIVSETGSVVHEERITCNDDCRSYLLNLNSQVTPGVYLINVLMDRRRLTKKLIVN